MRYLRLYLHFLRFSFSKAMEFRVDFFFRVIMDTMFYLIQFLFFHIIYLHTPILGGWDMEQMRIFICSYLFIDALNMTVFANNSWWFPIYVNRGDLDYYLTKPVSTLFFLSVREFAANSFLNLLLAITLLGWSLHQYPQSFNIWRIIIFVLLLINGTFLYYCVRLIFSLSVFWSQSPRGFSDLFFNLSHIMERPDRIFNSFFRFIFTFILPFSVMASFPAKFLLEENTENLIAIIFLVTAAVFVFAIWLWNKGLKNYTSASS